MIESNYILDSKHLLRALEGSFSSDSEKRKESERYLIWFSKQDGCVILLMQLLQCQSYDFNFRLAASIRLKNIITSQWSTGVNDSGTISSNDQLHLLTNLYSTIKAVGSAGNPIRKQCFEILRHVIFTLNIHAVSSIASNLVPDLNQRNDTDILCVALNVLKRICSRFEYHHESLQPEVDMMIDMFFNPLLSIAESAFQVGLSNSNAADLIHLVLKNYYSLGLLTSPSPQLVTGSLNHWTTIVKLILTYFIESPLQANIKVTPFAELPGDVESFVGSLPQYKCLKWCLRIINRFVSNLHSNWAISFQSQGLCIETTRLLLELFKNESYGKQILTNIVHFSAWNYLRHCIKCPPVYNAVLKPNISVLISRFLMQTFQYTVMDEAQYTEDPESFVCSSPDLAFQLYSSRDSAANFLRDATRSKPGDFIPCIVEVLNMAFLNSKVDAPSVYASLSIAGYTASRLLKNSRASGVEIKCQDLLQRLFQFLNQPNKWLVTRSAWLCGCLVRFSNTVNRNTVDPQVLVQIYRRILELLADEDLMISVHAAGALIEFIKLQLPQIQDAIVETLPLVMEFLFKLMERIELESIISALELLVQGYSSRIIPFACQIVMKICKTLSDAFTSDSISVSIDEQNNERVLARWTMLQTLNSVLKLTSTTPLSANSDTTVLEMIRSVLELFNVIFQPSTNQDGLLDYIDELGILLANVVYLIFSRQFTKDIHDKLTASTWKAFGCLVSSINSSRVLGDLNAIEHSCRPLLHFNPQGFTPDYAKAIMESCESAYKNGYYEECDELLYSLLDVSILSRSLNILLPNIITILFRRMADAAREIEYHLQYYKLACMTLIYISSDSKLPASVTPDNVMSIAKFIVETSPNILVYNSLRHLTVFALCFLIKAGIHQVGSVVLIQRVLAVIAGNGIKNVSTDELRDFTSSMEQQDHDASFEKYQDGDDESYSSFDNLDDEESDINDDFCETDDYSELGKLHWIKFTQETLASCPALHSYLNEAEVILTKALEIESSNN